MRDLSFIYPSMSIHLLLAHGMTLFSINKRWTATAFTPNPTNGFPEFLRQFFLKVNLNESAVCRQKQRAIG